MLLSYAGRLLREVSPRTLWSLAWNFAARNALAMHRWGRRRRAGRRFPPVLFISVTSRCNLRCQGCWVRSEPDVELSAGQLDRIIRQGRDAGVGFFGILGGEPLMYGPLWDVLARYRSSWFQVFTNGTLLTDAAADAMAALGNVTPLISVEGLEAVSDERRGGRGVYGRTMDAIERCRRRGLFIGAATSVCRSNLDDLASERYVQAMIDRGVHYVWYYIYRPVGPDPCAELALDEEQIARLRRFLVDIRPRAAMMVVDAYWDHLGRGLCPAATGVSYHVGPGGHIEPCPPVQFSAELATNGRPLADAIDGSAFLRAFAEQVPAATRGCVLMDRPDLLRKLVVEHAAADSSGRGTAMEELQAMTPRPSHAMEGRQMPERHWAYRLAKKHWFWGFGAYG